MAQLDREDFHIVFKMGNNSQCSYEFHECSISSLLLVCRTITKPAVKGKRGEEKDHRDVVG